MKKAKQPDIECPHPQNCFPSPAGIRRTAMETNCRRLKNITAMIAADCVTNNFFS